MYSPDHNFPDGLKAVYRPNAMANPQSSHRVAGLLLVLVFLLHGWLAVWLLVSKPDVVKKKPVTIEVSLLPSPTKQIQAEPVPKPSSAPVVKKSPPKKAKPVKSKPKPLPKPKPKPTVKPAVKTKTAPAKPKETRETVDKTVVEKIEAKPFVDYKTSPAPSAPSPASDTAKPSAKPSPKPATAKNAAPGQAQRATCVRCPNPTYPSIARRRGWQGSVLLKFQLTPDGLAQNIVVVRSSGRKLLDQAAIENAKESRFTRAGSGVIRTATKLFNFKLN